MPASTSPTNEPLATLLAVDLGLRSGLALYRRDGRLLWYRSTNFASVRRLKRALPGILDPLESLDSVILEGGGRLAEPWLRECQRRGIPCQTIAAESWRKQLLIPRQQQNSAQAKQSAGKLARAVIDCLGLKRPTSLRHDAAEAVLVGLNALLRRGWIDVGRLADSGLKPSSNSPPMHRNYSSP